MQFREGRLPALKIGRGYVIDKDNLKLVEERKVGRPAKAIAETNVAANKKKGSKK